MFLAGSVVILVMGLLLIVAPQVGVNKGADTTEEAIKKNRTQGIVFTVIGVALVTVWLV